MSKGASVERKLPKSNAKVAHHLTAQVIYAHLAQASSEPNRPGSEYHNWEKGVAELGAVCFFVSPIQDCCICACSPSGCTTLFVALRCIVLNSYPWRSVTQNDRFRKLILSLTVWQDSWPDISRAIVRMLTFDALGLAHTCCIEIQEFKTVRAPYVPGEAMDETEVDMILDDQHFLHEFEELMEEMESKLDELGLPLEEFLDGYWYDRVIEYLSRRDYYDEEHVTEARRMGIFLEAEEFCIPDRISLQFRSRVQDLQDGSLSDEFQSYESSAMA